MRTGKLQKAFSFVFVSALLTMLSGCSAVQEKADEISTDAKIQSLGRSLCAQDYVETIVEQNEARGDEVENKSVEYKICDMSGKTIYERMETDGECETEKIICFGEDPVIVYSRETELYGGNGRWQKRYLDVSKDIYESWSGEGYTVTNNIAGSEVSYSPDDQFLPETLDEVGEEVVGDINTIKYRIKRPRYASMILNLSEDDVAAHSPSFLELYNYVEENGPDKYIWLNPDTGLPVQAEYDYTMDIVGEDITSGEDRKGTRTINRTRYFVNDECEKIVIPEDYDDLT